MNITCSKPDWNIDVSGYFNGIPCRIIEETHIILDKQSKTISEFVESPEFQMLEGAGLEVHSGAYS